jgi:hypothetical protein
MADAALENLRKARRVTVSIPSRIRYAGDKLAEIEIKDLSFYGFSATGTLAVHAGSYVSVDLPSIGLVRARIAWIRGGLFGAVFPTAVDVRKCVLPARQP